MGRKYQNAADDAEGSKSRPTLAPKPQGITAIDRLHDAIR
jgi:hypothetical protein